MYFEKNHISPSLPPPQHTWLWERTGSYQGHLPFRGFAGKCQVVSAESGGDQMCLYDRLARASLRLLLLVPDSKIFIAWWKSWARLSEIVRICITCACLTRWLSLTGEWERLVLRGHSRFTWVLKMESCNTYRISFYKAGVRHNSNEVGNCKHGVQHIRKKQILMQCYPLTAEAPEKYVAHTVN